MGNKYPQNDQNEREKIQQKSSQLLNKQICPKIGTTENNQNHEKPTKKKGDSVPISTNVTKIRQTVNEFKNERHAPEIMDYSKYNDLNTQLHHHF